MLQKLTQKQQQYLRNFINTKDPFKAFLLTYNQEYDINKIIDFISHPYIFKKIKSKIQFVNNESLLSKAFFIAKSLEILDLTIKSQPQHALKVLKFLSKLYNSDKQNSSLQNLHQTSKKNNKSKTKSDDKVILFEKQTQSINLSDKDYSEQQDNLEQLHDKKNFIENIDLSKI